MKFRVTSVDKFHGPNKGCEVVELAPADLASVKALGAALRKVRLLSPGQSVHAMRGPNAWERGESPKGALGIDHAQATPNPYASNPVPKSAIIVFPRNAPGLTTGLHSLTLTPVCAVCHGTGRTMDPNNGDCEVACAECSGGAP